MSTFPAIPAARRLPQRVSRPWIIAPAAVVVLALGSAAYFFSRPGAQSEASADAYETVKLVDYFVTVKQKGELQAVSNTDIPCEVEGNTTIVKIVPEGSPVKKGDLLAELDSSAIAQRIDDTEIELQKANADATTSSELRDIQLLTNAANTDAAEVELRVAKLDLSAYTEGSYPQQLDKAKTDLELAKVTLKNKDETLANTRGLFNKGFVTAADVKTAEQDVVKAQFDLAAANNGLNVLAKYAHESDFARRESAVAQADQKLVRTKRENAAKLNQCNADLSSKQQNLSVIQRRMDKLKEQKAACTIIAPSDGMVVYGTSGDRNSQNQIQEGAAVRERQVIFRLPDSTAMKAVIRASESQVLKLREGQPATVNLSVAGIKEPLAGTVDHISPLADSSGRFWNPDSKEFPVDIRLTRTPPGLRPGTSADPVEVLVSRTPQALVVPLTTLFFAGQDVWVFVRDGDDLRAAKVKLGQLNEKQAQILSGVDQGAELKVLGAGEGQTILDRLGIKVAASTQPGKDWGSGPVPEGGRRGGKGGGNRGPRAEGATPGAPPAGAPPSGAPMPPAK